MSKCRSMYAGSSGSVYNVNANSPGNGNGKWQGLAPITNMRPHLVPYVRTRANGDDRNVVFCMNQLGGVGRVSNMFASTADGVHSESCAHSAGSTLGAILGGASDDNSNAYFKIKYLISYQNFFTLSDYEVLDSNKNKMSGSSITDVSSANTPGGQKYIEILVPCGQKGRTPGGGFEFSFTIRDKNTNNTTDYVVTTAKDITAGSPDEASGVGMANGEDMICLLKTFQENTTAVAVLGGGAPTGCAGTGTTLGSYSQSSVPNSITLQWQGASETYYNNPPNTTSWPTTNGGSYPSWAFQGEIAGDATNSQTSQGQSIQKENINDIIVKEYYYNVTLQSFPGEASGLKSLTVKYIDNANAAEETCIYAITLNTANSSSGVGTFTAQLTSGNDLLRLSELGTSNFTYSLFSIN